MSKLSDIKELIDSGVYNSELSNDNLVQILEHTAYYLNLQKVSVYAKENNISESAVYRYRNVINFRGFKLVVDND